jgi:hypothetical protein
MLIARALPARLLPWLLHLANAHPSASGRERFYALKDRLLEQLATEDGHDVQHLMAECWGWWAAGECTGSTCTKCGGTGIWHERWVLLRRYRLGRYVFHRPVMTRHFPPPAGDSAPHALIEGRIEHADIGRRSSNEARLWLALLLDRRLFVIEVRSGRILNPGWFPLSRIQWALFGLAKLGHRARKWWFRLFPICYVCRERSVREAGLCWDCLDSGEGAPF